MSLVHFQYITNTLSFKKFLTKFANIYRFHYASQLKKYFIFSFIFYSAFFEKALLPIDRPRIQRTMKLTRDLGRQNTVIRPHR